MRTSLHGERFGDIHDFMVGQAVEDKLSLAASCDCWHGEGLYGILHPGPEEDRIVRQRFVNFGVSGDPVQKRIRLDDGFRRRHFQGEG